MTALAGNLEKEIAKARLAVSADGYPMSIGELTSMYRDKELVIQPEFQRFFRWTDIQKSRLIESLLLGIPLPSIFVAQTSSGVWEVVDGLQRLSTILQLQGELRDTDGNKKDKLVLLGTKYLPSLNGKIWECDDEDISLTQAQRLDLKRTKIDIKIIKRESSPQAKFDLFQRLNSYGSSLNSQEMRSALMVAVSAPAFFNIEALSRHKSFVETAELSEKLVEERYDLELVTRFAVLHNWPSDKLSVRSLRDLSQVMDDRMIDYASSFDKKSDKLASVFKKTFDYIRDHGGEDVFRRWDVKRQEFKGSFLNSSFEVFALGVGYRIANGLPLADDLAEKAKQLWQMDKMKAGFSTGRSTGDRLTDLIPMGRELTAP